MNGYRILIRNNETKEERLSRPFEFEWDEGQLFYLTEGNYGCDCNREIEFERTGGRPDSEIDWDGPCSSGRFSIVKAVLDDGTSVPVDDLLDAEFLV